MSEAIILKTNPKIEFQFLESGFILIDKQTEPHSSHYAYNDLQSIELNKSWFPRLAKWLRITTCVLNGVPYFPNAETCKKANITINLKKENLGIWLTDSNMAGKAKKIKDLLEEKIKHNRQ